MTYNFNNRIYADLTDEMLPRSANQNLQHSRAMLRLDFPNGDVKLDAMSEIILN